MKLISDIINDLVDDQKSVNAALLKTKVLASRLQNEVLLSWVNNELEGYKRIEALPEYRKFRAYVVGLYIYGYTQYNNQPIPTIGLNPRLEEEINWMKFNQSISVIESMIKDNTSGKLEHTFSAEANSLIEDNWRRMGNPSLELVSSKKIISIAALVEIVASVRTKMLDFMLKIDMEFGNVTEIEELKDNKEKITNIMNQTIINNTGDGNVVNTGNDAYITAQINISRGDKQALEDHLRNIGVEESNMKELLSIIDTETPDYTSKIFGAKVQEWLQKMLNKVLNGTWDIGIGVAGNLLTDALKSYYGL